MPIAWLQRSTRVFSMNGYPFWRVLIGFTLCPALAGVVAFVITLVHGLILPNGANEAVLTLSILGASLMVAVTAFIIYVIPAFLLAVLYVSLKLCRGWKGFSFVFLAGGICALLWAELISPQNRGKDLAQVFLNNWSTWPFLLTFILGSVMSLFMAILILPSSDKKEAASARWSPRPKGGRPKGDGGG
jgi:hypothetical protein